MKAITSEQKKLLEELTEKFSEINSQIPKGTGIMKLELLINKADENIKLKQECDAFNSSYKESVRDFLQKYLNSIIKEFVKNNIPIEITLNSDLSFYIEVETAFRKANDLWNVQPINVRTWFKDKYIGDNIKKHEGHTFGIKPSDTSSSRYEFGNLDDLFKADITQSILYKMVKRIRDIQNKANG